MMEAAPEEFKRPTGEAATHNDDPYLIYFTSGTTGMPKMVAHCYTYPLGFVIGARFWHHTDDTDRTYRGRHRLGEVLLGQNLTDSGSAAPPVRLRYGQICA